jgi:hypothetical protein
MITGSQYSNELHGLWLWHKIEYEALKLKLDHLELEELKCEEHKCKELEFKLPPPAPIDTPTQPLTSLTVDHFSPSPTYKTTIGHQFTPTQCVITGSRLPPWPNKYPNQNQN